MSLIRRRAVTDAVDIVDLLLNMMTLLDSNIFVNDGVSAQTGRHRGSVVVHAKGPHSTAKHARVERRQFGFEAIRRHKAA